MFLGDRGAGGTPANGARFAAVAEASGIAVVRTPVQAPRANAIAERSFRSVRQECLNHLLPLGEAHLRHTLREYVAYFNQARPHQGRDQCVPEPGESLGPARADGGEITGLPILGACIAPTSAPPDATEGRARRLSASRCRGGCRARSRWSSGKGP